MRTLHLLVDEGITSELFVAALIDAGASVAPMQKAVDGAGLDVVLEAAKVPVRMVRGTRLTASPGPQAARTGTAAELHARIAAATLPERADARARLVADALIGAEAKVHGVPPDRVHFHEVGRAAAVALLLAAAVALEELGIDRVTTTSVALGRGTIDIAHGRFPVPPPAVLHLMAGLDVHAGYREGELTTPSGAAIVAALAEPVPALPRLRLDGHGRGVTADERILTVMHGTSTTSSR